MLGFYLTRLDKTQVWIWIYKMKKNVFKHKKWRLVWSLVGKCWIKKTSIEVFCTRLGVLMRREIKIQLNLKAYGIYAGSREGLKV